MTIDIRGVLHVHSTYSDGTGSPQEIVRAAKDAGLDFVVLNDHDTLQALYDGVEGIYDGVALIAGTEISFDKSHYLVLGLSEIPKKRGWEKLRKIGRENNTLGIIAHPYDRDKPLFGLPGYRWSLWEFTDFHGIEIWNYLSDFGGNVTSIFRGVLAPFFPDLFISGPSEETLKLWDELTRTRRVVGVGGADAHALKIRVFFLTLTIFPYRKMFRAVTVHVLVDHLPETFSARKEAIIRALTLGRCYTAYEWYEPVTGFSFKALGEGEKLFTIGDTVQLKKCRGLHIESPTKAEIRLLVNGKIAAKSFSHSLEYMPEVPGAYRVELYRKHLGRKRPFIYSNPIYVV